MSIDVMCPSCGGAFKAPDSAAGKKAKCPKCGGAIEIPVSSSADDILDAEVEAPRSFDDEYEVEPPASPPDAADDRKPCPMCGEPIQRGAVKCRYCGEIFDPILKAQQKKLSLADDPDASLTKAEWLLAIICSGIGCIMGIIWMIQGKPKGKKMLLVSFCMQLLWGLLRAAMVSVPPHR